MVLCDALEQQVGDAIGKRTAPLSAGMAIAWFIPAPYKDVRVSTIQKKQD
jgi:hypothetical protein